METIISTMLAGASGVGAYFLVVGFLLLCGLGLPLPEDVILITGGYLVYNAGAKLSLMLLFGFLGILAGDSIIFLLGRHLGDKLTRRWPFRTIVTPEKRQKVEKLFAKYGEKIVMIARFMPGVRAVTFFCAGTAGMRWRRFALFDGLAALVSAPLFILLGYHFGSNIEWVIHNVRKGQKAALLVVAAVALVWTLVHLVRRRRENAEKKPAPELPEKVRVTEKVAPLKTDARAAE